MTVRLKTREALLAYDIADLETYEELLHERYIFLKTEVEKRTGRPGGFIESDLVDPRYFSAANIKNRLESYLQMVDARRQGEATA